MYIDNDEYMDNNAEVVKTLLSIGDLSLSYITTLHNKDSSNGNITRNILTIC